MKMLDTTILKIMYPQFLITNCRRFGLSSLVNLTQITKPFEKFVNNPTREEKERAYYPRLALIKRIIRNGREIFLKVEFSCQKIMFNDNLNEYEETDFDYIVNALSRRMLDMGVSVSKEDIKNAIVLSFHTAKNVPLTDGYTSSFAIKELSKVNLNRKLNFRETRFNNDGSALQYYSLSHSLVFYDKVKDLSQSPKKAIDKDQTPKQLNLLSLIEGFKKPLEILRIEARLTQKVKMNSILRKLGYKPNPLFKDIFKKKLCQDILKFYWGNMVIDKGMLVFDVIRKPLRIFQRTIKNNPNIKPKQALYLTGLELIAKDEGIGTLRDNIGLISSPNAWYRISRDLKYPDIYKKDIKPHGFIKNIEESLNNFDSFRIETYQLAM